MKSYHRNLRAGAATLVAGAAVAGGASVLAQQQRRAPATPRPLAATKDADGPTLRTEVVTARAESGADAPVLLSGQVEPYQTALLSAEVADVVTARPVRQGERVAAGQVIALLDDRLSRAGLDQALAAAAQASAARRQAESEYRRAAVETDAARSQARAALAQAGAAAKKTRSFTRRQELRQAEADRDQAKTDEALARLEADRYRRLVAEGAIAQQVLDRAQAAFDAAAARRRAADERASLAAEGARQEDIASAAAQVDSASAGVRAADARPDRLAALRAQIDALEAQEAATRAAVRQARIDLGRHVVRAPFAGRVLETLVEAGERATPGAPLVRLGSLARTKLTVSVPEALRPALYPGLTVRATADALPGAAFVGRLSVLGARADARTRAFPVEVTVENPGERLLPNMVVRLALPGPKPVADAPRRVTIPVTAVAAEEGRASVLLIEDGRAVRRPITLGAPVGTDRVTVTAGLRGGEVIAAAPSRLTDGARVVVVPPSAAVAALPAARRGN